MNILGTVSTSVPEPDRKAPDSFCYREDPILNLDNMLHHSFWLLERVPAQQSKTMSGPRDSQEDREMG